MKTVSGATRSGDRVSPCSSEVCFFYHKITLLHLMFAFSILKSHLLIWGLLFLSQIHICSSEVYIFVHCVFSVHFVFLYIVCSLYILCFVYILCFCATGTLLTATHHLESTSGVTIPTLSLSTLTWEIRPEL